LIRVSFEKEAKPFFCLDTKETKNQWPPDKKLKATSKIGLRAKPLA